MTQEQQKPTSTLRQPVSRREAFFLLAGALSILAYFIFPTSRASDSHATAGISGEAPATRHHAYVYENSGMYGYQLALTQQDEQSGIKAKPLVMVRYLGTLRGKQHWVEIDSPAQQVEFLCDQSCRFVTMMSFNFMGATGAQQVVEVAPGTIVEAIVGDIMSGDLRPSSLRTGTYTDAPPPQTTDAAQARSAEPVQPPEASAPANVQQDQSSVPTPVGDPTLLNDRAAEAVRGGLREAEAASASAAN